jgi:hypothetical protein
MKNLYKIKDELYIINSSKQVNFNDYYITTSNTIAKADIGGSEVANKNKSPKIILTTNKLLIKDGVQAIDDTFLEWFVNNPSCEYVDINRDWGYPKIIIPQEEPKLELPQLGTKEFVNMCESIFGGKPKQETNLSKHLDSYPEYPGPRRSAIVSKQETLEEAYLNKLIDEANKEFTLDRKLAKEVAIKFAKWQAEQDNNKFSEKVETLWVRYRKTTNNEDAWSFKEWLVEQFKNK